MNQNIFQGNKKIIGFLKLKKKYIYIERQKREKCHFQGKETRRYC